MLCRLVEVKGLSCKMNGFCVSGSMDAGSGLKNRCSTGGMFRPKYIFSHPFDRAIDSALTTKSRHVEPEE